ncbi:hypothetical protein JW998_01780 [candidate division KSB1 bacterium]|nr:hypothetical protein [candidate division KSB1 bacterium]
MRFLTIFFIFLASHLAFSMAWNIKGQASGWNNTNFADVQNTQVGMQYLPQAELTVAENPLIDADIALNATSSYDFKSESGSTDISIYRAWARYSTSQFEARMGLQQIKFGPAMILRPLMWFDQLDPRDPLQFTKGVAAGLLRYYFLNNANIWLWGLLSNGERKGAEIIPSADNSLEFGGRIQHPVSRGEVAFTYHHRNANADPLLEDWLKSAPGPIPENRYALDGKWDVGIGLWFEGVLSQKEIAYVPINYEKYLTIGADYTVGLGNGLHVLGEHLFMNTSATLDDYENRTEFSAVLADYHVTLWDMVMGIVYYNWKTNDSYKFLTWRRTYDNWSFNAAFYWNPATSSVAGLTQNERSTFGLGKGFQFMVIFNH